MNWVRNPATYIKESDTPQPGLGNGQAVLSGVWPYSLRRSSSVDGVGGGLGVLPREGVDDEGGLVGGVADDGAGRDVEFW